MAAKFPNLITEWNAPKNGSLTPDVVVAGSNNKVWWICEKGHEWQAQIGNRTRPNGSGCPYCSGNRFHTDNCLATKHPEVSKTWVKEKNGDVTPYDVLPGSTYKAWWACQTCGELWKCRVSGRVKGKYGCPKCSAQARALHSRLKRLKIFGTLREKAPGITHFWDSNQNGNLTPDNVGRHYTTAVHWKCPGCGFRWECSPHKFRGCPSCSKKVSTIK